MSDTLGPISDYPAFIIALFFFLPLPFYSGLGLSLGYFHQASHCSVFLGV
jgi:ABC-type multidrug transport system permease subunit